MASGNKKSGTKTSSNKKISGNLNSRSRTKQTRANVKKTGTTRMTKKQLAAEQAGVKYAVALSSLRQNRQDRGV